MAENIKDLHRRGNELLQELRVMQTGVQIVTAFLMTLPFQARFAELNQFQVEAYVVLLVFSGLVSALILMPVAIHREYFGLKIKEVTVDNGHRLVRWALAAIALLICGCIIFITIVVLADVAAWVIGAAASLVILVMVLVVPRFLRRRQAEEDDSESLSEDEPEDQTVTGSH